MTEKTSGDEDLIKEICINIAKNISDDEAFVVSKRFDKLYNTRKVSGVGTNENAWTIDPEYAGYALLVVIFIRDVFLKAMTEELAKRASEKLCDWVGKSASKTNVPAGLKEDLLLLVETSNASNSEKARLIEAIEKTF